jgi:CRISPR-associated protein (TIGR02710 family)
MSESGPLLMLFTIGGSPAPVAESLFRARPDLVVFICSRRSAESLTAPDGVLARLAAKGLTLNPGQYEVLTLTNEEDLLECVEDMRAFLNPRVGRWLERGPRHRLWADFTGGTKCMSVALGLVTRAWPCEMVYVGGAQRTKGGLGVTIDGFERFLNRENPWNALGYEAADQAVSFFNAGHFPAASSLLRHAAVRASAPHIKRALATFASLAEAYAFWNLAQVRRAIDCLDVFLKNSNDMICFGFSPDGLKLLRAQVASHLDWLNRLGDGLTPTREWLADLLADARRRLDAAQFDDAVARLYRFIEAAAQHQFLARDLSTSSFPLDALPEALRPVWAYRAVNGHLRLGLHDAYDLLHRLGDPLAAAFREHKLHTRTSPLEARNASRFGHGFQPISEKHALALWDAALALAAVLGIQPEALPVFPRLQ